MGELRKDYLLDRFVIVSEKRGKRPHELEKRAVIHEDVCRFCPGNEQMTPPECGRVPRNGGWAVRWFDNLFGALHPEGDPVLKTRNRFFTFASSFGFHEIVVETPRHDKQLADLSAGEIEDVLHVYARRILDLESKEKVQYVSVFKNNGLFGGTSLVHSHSQVMALPFIPSNVQEKIGAMRRFLRCPYCSIIEEERKGVRKC